MSFLPLRDGKMRQTPAENCAGDLVDWEKEEKEDNSYSLSWDFFSPVLLITKQTSVN